MVALLVAAGCQRLPSLVPLSDSGETLSAPSTHVDRRSSNTGDEGEDEDEEDAEEMVVTAELPAVAPVSDAGVAADAGPAEATADAGAATEPSWPGEYYGSDRFAWRGPDGEEMVEVDDRAHTRVEAAGPKAIVISIVNSATGEVICPLRAATAGNRAMILPRETCFGSPDQEAVVTDGRAALEGDRLVLDFKGHIETEDDEDEDFGGEGTYHFEGRRR